MALLHFRMLNNELLKKHPDVVPKQEPIIILDIKSDVCMSKNGRDTKHTRHISRIMHIVRNDKERNIHKTVWCEGSLKITYIGTNNVRGYELNSQLGCSMVRLEN